MREKTFPLVAVQSFIEATRDTGYKSTGSALAELVDNAFEAAAMQVDVTIDGAGGEIVITVTDDGTGMTPAVLRQALQFGGSTRFGSRIATGRYGMGLPNGSLSQARRVEVVTWTAPRDVWSCYLDVDEIVAGKMHTVPMPVKVEGAHGIAHHTGTRVTLRKCDRLDSRSTTTLEGKLAREFGRIFRRFLYEGKRVRINGNDVVPVDPLFLKSGANITGAMLYGPPLTYEIRVPAMVGWPSPVSTVTVRFTELPLEKWYEFSNEDKNRYGIAKNAGVSIMRAGREIDYGWYFMGTKRKENYDDWWRCEISFSPELDELFGVTHSKQKINPTEAILHILTPDVERIGRDLNTRVRNKYMQVRAEGAHAPLLRRLEAKDHLVDPPRPISTSGRKAPQPELLRRRNEGVYGLQFALSHAAEDHAYFYSSLIAGGRLSLTLNESHPFYSSAYVPLLDRPSVEERRALESVILLLISSARADAMLSGAEERAIMGRFRKIWSDTVAAFLS